jgi:uncharacterized membrane protein
MEDSNIKPNEKQTSNGKNTLSKFIEDNHKLISVLGVFTAITVFSGNMQLRTLGYVLSFIFLLITLIIWTELLEKFPKGTATWRLTAFEDLLAFSFLGILLHWFVAYRDIWHYVMPLFLTIVLATILLGLFSHFIKKFDIFNRVFHVKAGGFKFLRYVLLLTIILLVFWGSMIIAAVITQPINKVLDNIHEQIEKNIPEFVPNKLEVPAGHKCNAYDKNN